MQDLFFLTEKFYVVRVGRGDNKQYNPITLSLNDDHCVEKSEIYIYTQKYDDDHAKKNRLHWQKFGLLQNIKNIFWQG